MTDTMNRHVPDNTVSSHTILLTGVNHQTAPVEVREKVSFSPGEAPAALDALVAAPSVLEAVLISTCNRTEVLLTTDNPAAAQKDAVACLTRQKGLLPAQVEPYLYLHQADAAVRHIFRVASGLDSMIMGEPQIFGQVKDAYRLAVERKTSGVILNRLIHKTFLVAKRVRSETGIGDSAVSVSYAAVELAKKIFGTLEGKSVLLIGAGEMAELAVEHFAGQQVKSILVANRTFERAVELARRYQGQAVSFQEIPEMLGAVDIVVSSTGAPGFVITRDQVKQVMRGRRNNPIFFIDIAVPRDIDPEINRVANAYVYDIDDLKTVIDENVKQRQQEAIRAERIVDEAVLTFRAWYESLDVVPTIVSLREKVADMAHAEAAKTLGSALKHLPAQDRETVHKMTDAIVNKLLHDPTTFLKQIEEKKDKTRYLDIIRRLFKLES
ncbi:MAG: glutamyl-tRNA reductase [Thermodesulfobacteriota bacterium]